MDTNFTSTNTTSHVYTGEAATPPLRGAGSHGRSDLPHAPGKSFSTGGSEWPKGVLTYRPHKTTPEEHERRVSRIKEIQAEHGIFIEAAVTSSASRSGGPSWQEWACQAASDTAASAWRLLERGANALMPQVVGDASTSQDAGTCPADASQCTSMGESKARESERVEKTPSPPPATADARTTAFNSFLQKHKLRALTPDLVPLELTSLDGKLVIFLDKHDEVEMHKGLASFFKAHLRPNDRVLGETVNTCELAERCRIIDDPDAQEALVKAIGSLLKAAKHALAELEQAKVGGNEGLKFWKDTAKLLANPDGNAAADLMKLGRQMARALPNWRTDKSLPDKVRKALIKYAESDRAFAKAASGTMSRRDRHMTAEMKSEQRAAGPGNTVFSIIGAAHAERERKEFANDPAVVLIELNNLGGFIRELARQANSEAAWRTFS